MLLISSYKKRFAESHCDFIKNQVINIWQNFPGRFGKDFDSELHNRIQNNPNSPLV